MRICFFSDIHGNGASFDAFLRCMDSEQPDQVIFGGDFCGYYYDSIRIMREIKQRQYQCLRGNHDQMLLDCIDGKLELSKLVERYGSSYKHLLEEIGQPEIEFLRNLPQHMELEVDALKLGFYHGSPRDYLWDRIYPDANIDDKEPFNSFDYLFMGHTHHKMVKLVGDTWLLNPGSAGQQRDGRGTSYLIFDTCSRIFKIVSFAYDRTIVEHQIDTFDTENESMNYKLKEVLFRKR